jgi:ABC-type phosphate/phosphonate transport system substrate-binding protein
MNRKGDPLARICPQDAKPVRRLVDRKPGTRIANSYEQELLMKGQGYLGSGFALLAVAWIATMPPGSARAQTSGKTIKIGLVKSLFRDTPESLLQVLSQPLKALMEAQTGLAGELQLRGDALNLGGLLNDKQVDLGVFHGFEYAWARQKYPNLKPLVIAVNHQQVLKAYLVVHKDSPVRTVADLKGKTLTLINQTREHCHLFLERRCLGGEQKPKQFFGEVNKYGDADDALADVVDELAQAALVDGLALENYRKTRPNRAAKLRVLLESEPFPAGVVAYNPATLDEATLQRFRDGMVTANQTKRGKELLNMVRMTGFEPLPKDFDQILNDIVRAYPPPADK